VFDNLSTHKRPHELLLNIGFKDLDRGAVGVSLKVVRILMILTTLSTFFSNLISKNSFENNNLQHFKRGLRPVDPVLPQQQGARIL